MCRILHFFCEFVNEILSGFRDKFQTRVTCVAFSLKFAIANQKLAENSEICENYSIYSILFNRVLSDIDLLQSAEDVGVEVHALRPLLFRSISSCSIFHRRIAAQKRTNRAGVALVTWGIFTRRAGKFHGARSRRGEAITARLHQRPFYQ